MSITYVIEKWSGVGAPDLKSSNRYDWRGAWGLKPRSYPKASSEAEAIAIFQTETARSRKCAFRLVALGGMGFGVTSKIISSVNCPDQAG